LAAERSGGKDGGRRLAEGARKIIFDLSGVTVIDSTGIGRFIASFNKIMAAGGEMRMAGLPAMFCSRSHQPAG